jgi:hypothetical protein
MEVHHHPHVEKKSFKEYILEGLMIFLAVSMGFIAENIRENITDHERAEVFMKSLLEDIKDDRRILDKHHQTYSIRLPLLDSLIDQLSGSSFPGNTNNLYYYARLASKSDKLIVNTRTIDQMKNSGSFRVIKNEQVAADIMAYYLLTEQIRDYERIEDQEENEYRKNAVQIFNASVFNSINSTLQVLRPENNPTLRVTDRKIAGDLAGWVHYVKNTRISIDHFKSELMKKGEFLTDIIKKEYHIENN